MGFDREMISVCRVFLKKGKRHLAVDHWDRHSFIHNTGWWSTGGSPLPPQKSGLSRKRSVWPYIPDRFCRMPLGITHCRINHCLLSAPPFSHSNALLYMLSPPSVIIANIVYPRLRLVCPSVISSRHNWSVCPGYLLPVKTNFEIRHVAYINPSGVGIS